MNKKITLLSISLITATGFAMQQGQHLKAWVLAANSIHVSTPLKLINDHLPITNNSTVLDVKTHIKDMEGIPVAQQSLFPLYYTYEIIIPSEKRGENLPDNVTIKQIMNLYDTERFLLAINLPRVHESKG